VVRRRLGISVPGRYAVRQGRHYELVETLLAHSADPNMADNQNVTPIHHAAASANPGFVLLLQAHGAKVSSAANKKAPLPPLHIAARRGNLETSRVLIQLGAKPNEAAKSRKRPLHFAAHGGHSSIVSLLLESGADVDATDGTTLTALMYRSALSLLPAFLLLPNRERERGGREKTLCVCVWGRVLHDTVRWR
jgi:ankyrin repeat protein